MPNDDFKLLYMSGILDLSEDHKVATENLLRGLDLRNQDIVMLTTSTEEVNADSNPRIHLGADYAELELRCAALAQEMRDAKVSIDEGYLASLRAQGVPPGRLTELRGRELLCNHMDDAWGPPDQNGDVYKAQRQFAKTANFGAPHMPFSMGASVPQSQTCPLCLNKVATTPDCESCQDLVWQAAIDRNREALLAATPTMKDWCDTSVDAYRLGLELEYDMLHHPELVTPMVALDTETSAEPYQFLAPTDLPKTWTVTVYSGKNRAADKEAFQVPMGFIPVEDQKYKGVTYHTWQHQHTGARILEPIQEAPTFDFTAYNGVPTQSVTAELTGRPATSAPNEGFSFDAYNGVKRSNKIT